jgi:hypothetical protein
MTKRKHPRVGTDPRTGRPIVKYRDPSGRQRTKEGFASPADAKAWDAMNQADMHRGRWTDPAGGRVLFSDWGARWHATTVNLRPSSRAPSHFSQRRRTGCQRLGVGDVRHAGRATSTQRSRSANERVCRPASSRSMPRYFLSELALRESTTTALVRHS